MRRSHSERWQSKSLVFCCVYYYLLFLPLLFVWKCCVYCIAFRLITLLCCCLLLSPIRMIYLPICTCLNALPTACPRSSHMCYASWAKKKLRRRPNPKMGQERWPTGSSCILSPPANSTEEKKKAETWRKWSPTKDPPQLDKSQPIKAPRFK